MAPIGIMKWHSTVYQKEHRLAFRLFAGAVTTKISKRPSG